MNHYRVSHDDLKVFCREVFATLGVAQEAAQTVADNLVEAELRGVKSHGIAKVKEYSSNLEKKVFNNRPDIKIVKEGISTFAIDGDFGLGAVTGKWAMERCLDKAQTSGVAFATVNRGRHFGMAAFYSMMALEQDMIGIALCNSGSIMTVYGGISRALGTNPISIAVPAVKKYPLVFDAATSQAAFNRIVVANLENRNIPEGWAIDKDGKPTVKAADALLGAVVPFGGYKGSGLAVIVNVLSGILSSAFLAATAENDVEINNGVGFFLGAIRIANFLDVDVFKQAVDVMITDLKSSRCDEKTQTIYMPGELEYVRKEENVKLGVEISDAVLKDLLEVQQKYGIQHKLF
ncbi:MAG TPA: Ldh family oxidoreductase [Negativicutes bacterium]|jgi:LDH2 family malate/lactate/ureidoglycolate dehydrogenase